MYNNVTTMINKLVGETAGTIMANIVRNKTVLVINEEDKNVEERFKISYMFFFMQIADIIANDMKDVESGGNLYGHIISKVLESIRNIGTHIVNAADSIGSISEKELNALAENIKSVNEMMNAESKSENNNKETEEQDNSFGKTVKSIFTAFMNK